MNILNYSIAFLSDGNSWINEYIIEFAYKIELLGHNVDIIHEINEKKKYDMMFILSYSKILTGEILRLNKNNLVVHESDLPAGKGWSPLSWQILKGNTECKITLFEADEYVDSGKIYLKDIMYFTGNELIDEIRKIQSEYTLKMCLDFILNRKEIIDKAIDQEGVETFYPKRTPKDSELNINKTIKEQFNLLRIVDNEKYPAFFYINNEKYVLKIIKDK